MRAVASGSGLSRSALYRAFAPVGGVRHEILRRRVARLRSAIFRSGRDVRISNLVWILGFATPSHAAQAFNSLRPRTGAAPRGSPAPGRAPLEDLEPDHLRGSIRGLSGSSRLS
ncbi:hypothetical protein ASG63_01705 [Methylobacterium sp. Leaf94]|uniref:AraC family transcriptional regulator n=1 Tax=Methylobacterium sp. Leaf94 TaxID=1736250 RepID=UPI0006FD809D|nr:AraC family transcriptional regulator [Methylobacterium sp. Leaf94]KQU35357.1 hypothetical protein ASG63_01705 [Methylobacterium sp. Leaf94]